MREISPKGLRIQNAITSKVLQPMEGLKMLIITTGKPENRALGENINKIIRILGSITRNIHLVTFVNKDYIEGLPYSDIHSLKSYNNRFLDFINLQLLVAKKIFFLSRKNDYNIVFFVFGSDLLLIPLIIAKLRINKIIIRSDGRPSVFAFKNHVNPYPIKKILFQMIEYFDYRMADILLTECEYMITDNNFQYFNAMIGNLFIDERFSLQKPHRKRNYDFGYIGRLNRDKGIYNFLDALDRLDVEYEIRIHGSGEEKVRVCDRINGSKPNINITYTDWIERNELPILLNDLKLLVVPSYIEGLPNIILEAMACGTPVLATPVGGIPGVIKNDFTGFILENNSSDSIAKSIPRVLASPDLDEIILNGKQIVDEQYSYDQVVKKWTEIVLKISMMN